MITIENLSLQLGDFKLNDLNMSLPAGEYGVLMGPTGCGKTTIVEAICGLRRIVSGKIVLDQLDISQLPPSRRQIGYVPQDAALFPTMRVEKQIEFALEIRNQSVQSRRKRVDELAELLEITPLLKRLPHGLSGGERQRVAIARALSVRPKLLCLDEPLSALDEPMRERMIEFLKAVHQRENTTILHVTHNQTEAKHLETVRFAMTHKGSLNAVPPKRPADSK